ncbi:MAG TPA: hypothetical protein ENN43_01280 [bacterium]|nr:hypothetical protein [bacterium]
MRRFKIFLALSFISAAVVCAEDRQIKVHIEAASDTVVMQTTEPGVYLSTKRNPFLSNIAEMEKKTTELKAMADKNVMEREILDAIIIKIVDIEQELERQARIQAVVIAALALLLVFCVVYIAAGVIKRVRGDKKGRQPAKNRD